jgi:hypothetical protein
MRIANLDAVIVSGCFNLTFRGNFQKLPACFLILNLERGWGLDDEGAMQQGISPVMTYRQLDGTGVDKRKVT